MLRLYFIQLWFNFSDEGTEGALYDMPVLVRFAGIYLSSELVPDATSLKNFIHLLIGVVVELLHDQNPNHGLGWIGRTAALWVRCTRSHPINLCGQGIEVDTGFNLRQSITQMINLFSPIVWGKQVVFDRARLLHRIHPDLPELATLLPDHSTREGFLRCPDGL